MKDHVWLLADQTGQVSYFEHGAEGDAKNWRTIGPMAFTARELAEESAGNPRFLPVGVRPESFTVLEVEALAFVQAIFNGFPPVNTDVFILDDGVFPLTSAGATWVDEAFGVPVWEPLFDEDGNRIVISWLDRVLEQVAACLDMDMETIRAIGDVNAATEDLTVKIEQTKLLVQEHVRIAIVPEPGTLVLSAGREHHILSSAAQFWLHTDGMAHFGLPELEIHDVPCWWVTAAGAELHGWACFALDRGLADGDEHNGGGPVPLQLRFASSSDEFWKKDGRECLCIKVVQALFVASHQKHESSDMVH